MGPETVVVAILLAVTLTASLANLYEKVDRLERRLERLEGRSDEPESSAIADGSRPFR